MKVQVSEKIYNFVRQAEKESNAKVTDENFVMLVPDCIDNLWGVYRVRSCFKSFNDTYYAEVELIEAARDKLHAIRLSQEYTEGLKGENKKFNENNFNVWDKEQQKFLAICSDDEENGLNKGQAMIRYSETHGLYFTLSGARDDDGYPYEVDALVLPCSGLKDINEVELYAGDLVLLEYRGFTNVSIVKFVNGCFEVEYSRGLAQFDGPFFTHYKKGDYLKVYVESQNISYLGSVFDSNSIAKLSKDDKAWALEKREEFVGEVSE